MEEIETDRWFVYVLRCRDDSLYCGASPNPSRRFYEHMHTSRGAKYTRSRRPLKYVCEWHCDGRSEALKMEARFKKLHRIDKEHHIFTKKAP